MQTALFHVTLATVLLASQPLRADGPGRGETAEEPGADDATASAAAARARQHNAKAKKLFNLGMFREAAEHYQAAYKAKPVAAFLFNLAQCYKRLRAPADLERAVFYFKAYLNAEPYTPVRADVEQQIGKLEQQLRRARADKPRPRPFYKKWWFWTIVGTAVAAGAATGTILALQPEDELPPITDHRFGTGGAR